jgi:hypothetical protein
MTYDTGIFIFNRITDENKWKLFLKSVYNYFLQHQHDSRRMVVNRNETTGEFQPLVTEWHPVVTDLKWLHLTDQFNFIKGDEDDSFTATWRTSLAEHLYGKGSYKLTEEEKAIVYKKSLKKMRKTAKLMNYSFTEDELLEIVKSKDHNTGQKPLSINPPIAISIEGITLPLYAHHFKKAWGQVWHPMCSEDVIKIFYKLLKHYFSEEEHYCYFNELNYLNIENEPPTRYYSSDDKYRQHATTETRKQNDEFYREIQEGKIDSIVP